MVGLYGLMHESKRSVSIGKSDMKTYETKIGGGSRTQTVRVQADNMIKARNLLERQYGEKIRWNIKEIHDGGGLKQRDYTEQYSSSKQGGNKKRLGCLPVLVIIIITMLVVVIMNEIKQVPTEKEVRKTETVLTAEEARKEEEARAEEARRVNEMRKRAEARLEELRVEAASKAEEARKMEKVRLEEERAKAANKAEEARKMEIVRLEELRVETARKAGAVVTAEEARMAEERKAAPSGFIALSGVSMTWADAKVYCQRQNGRLPFVGGSKSFGGSRISDGTPIDGFGTTGLNSRWPTGLPNGIYWIGTADTSNPDNALIVRNPGRGISVESDNASNNRSVVCVPTTNAKP
jgi:uncharacterized membrane protein